MTYSVYKMTIKAPKRSGINRFNLKCIMLAQFLTRLKKSESKVKRIGKHNLRLFTSGTVGYPLIKWRTNLSCTGQLPVVPIPHLIYRRISSDDANLYIILNANENIENLKIVLLNWCIVCSSWNKVAEITYVKFLGNLIKNDDVITLFNLTFQW